MSMSVLLLAALCSGPSYASEIEEAPEFLLSDIDVRVDLNKKWKMTRWSDFDLKAETAGPVFLFTWATDVQSDVSTFDAKVWKPMHLDKLEEMGGGIDPKVTNAEVVTIKGRNTALVDISFKLQSGGEAVLLGSTTAVEGRMVHVAFVAGKRFAKSADKHRLAILEDLDVKAAEADVAWGVSVEADGFSNTLAEGWRAPLEAEESIVTIAAGKMGVENTGNCWLALRPHGPATADSMIACQGGLMLGVIDEYSFEGVEPTIRERMFGKAEVGPAKQLELEDRLAFIYDITDKGLAVGVVPYEKGVARIWTIGEAGDETLLSALEEVLKSGDYGGAHPASAGDQLSYYTTYRPFSPVVLCPLFGILLLGGSVVVVGGIMMARGKKNKYDLDDDDV